MDWMLIGYLWLAVSTRRISLLDKFLSCAGILLPVCIAYLRCRRAIRAVELERIRVQDVGLGNCVRLLWFFHLGARGINILVVFPIREGDFRTVRGAVNITEFVRSEHLYSRAGKLCKGLAVRMTVAIVLAAGYDGISRAHCIQECLRGGGAGPVMPDL